VYNYESGVTLIPLVALQ